jgi:hypothetical protein
LRPPSDRIVGGERVVGVRGPRCGVGNREVPP